MASITFTEDIAGRWYYGITDCAAATEAVVYEVRINASELVLAGPDQTLQSETIVGYAQGWLRATDANQRSSYYQRRGRSLAYRRGEIDDEEGETTFLRCDAA